MSPAKGMTSQVTFMISFAWLLESTSGLWYNATHLYTTDRILTSVFPFFSHLTPSLCDNAQKNSMRVVCEKCAELYRSSSSVRTNWNDWQCWLWALHPVTSEKVIGLWQHTILSFV